MMTPYDKQMKMRQKLLRLKAENKDLHKQIEETSEQLEELLHRMQSRL